MSVLSLELLLKIKQIEPTFQCGIGGKVCNASIFNNNYSYRNSNYSNGK